MSGITRMTITVSTDTLCMQFNSQTMRLGQDGYKRDHCRINAARKATGEYPKIRKNIENGSIHGDLSVNKKFKYNFNCLN